MTELNVTSVQFDNNTYQGSPEELKYQLCHAVDQLANIPGALFYGNILAYDPSQGMMQHANMYFRGSDQVELQQTTIHSTIATFQSPAEAHQLYNLMLDWFTCTDIQAIGAGVYSVGAFNDYVDHNILTLIEEQT